MSNKKILLPLFLCGAMQADCLNDKPVSKALFLGGVQSLFAAEKSEKKVELSKKIDYVDGYNFRFDATGFEICFVTLDKETVSYAKYQEKDSSFSIYRVSLNSKKGKAKNYLFAMMEDASSFDLLLPSQKAVKSDQLTTDEFNVIRKQLMNITENIDELAQTIKALDFKKVHTDNILEMDVDVFKRHEAVFKGLHLLEQTVPVKRGKVISSGKPISIVRQEKDFQRVS